MQKSAKYMRSIFKGGKSKMRSITVREWISKFNNGEFEAGDFDTQTKAGWNDWFCPDRELASRLKKMGNLIKNIENDYILDNFFLVFYNICSIDYPLFDQARFTPFRRIADKDFEFVLSFDCPYKPSSSASGTDTSGIKDNTSENNKITENIMKPENTTNRPVAELKVSSNSVSIEEGKSTSVTATVRPNDAANKTLTWKSSNESVATVSNGTISGKKPGSCQVTVSTTDGSGISKTIAVTVTKKPDPPKPVIPSNKGGDGVPRVGDVVTFTGKYYYDSWGKRPAGSLYSGVKNGVVIDSYSSKDFGGSARYTGDLKVHIKPADGRYGDLGWVRLSQISGYAKGTPGVDRDQIAIVDEEGRELQIPNGKGGRITKLEKGTGVIPHTATEKLMALSEQLDNNGNMVINGRTIEEYVNDMANMQSIAVPDFSDVTASVVSQLEGKGIGNVTVENHYDSLLNVEGNVDKDVLPGLEDILKRSYEYTSKQMVKELRKGGMQIRR